MNGCPEIDYTDKSVMHPYFFTESLYMRNIVCDSGKGIKIFSGDTKNCFATKKNTTEDGKIRPNFRAVIKDCQLANESIIPSSVIDADEVKGTYHLAPRVELYNCTGVVCDAVNTPAVVKINDCEISKLEEGGVVAVTVFD